MASARGMVTVMEVFGVVAELDAGVLEPDCFLDLLRFRSGDVTLVTASMALATGPWPVVFGVMPIPGGGDGFLRPGIGRFGRLLLIRLTRDGFGGFLAGNG
jgi:hypothetical protein